MLVLSKSQVPDTVDIHALVGDLIEDVEARENWRRLISNVHDASQPGGLLQDWLFHGTTREITRHIAIEGVTTTDVLVRDGNHQSWVSGTYWGTPLIAAFYAEDHLYDEQVDIALVAVRIADLEDEGALIQDEQSLDFPIFSRLGFGEDEVARIWGSLSKTEPAWKASLAATGALVCLGPVCQTKVTIIKDINDFFRLTEKIRDKQSAVAPR
jgi:hypothetical protein